MKKPEEKKKIVPHTLRRRNLRPQVTILIIICCLFNPLAIYGADKTLKSDTTEAVQDFSWIKNEYNSKMQNKYGFAYWINVSKGLK